MKHFVLEVALALLALTGAIACWYAGFVFGALMMSFASGVGSAFAFAILEYEKHFSSPASNRR